ncbi:MAG: hypothetical protein Q8K70_04125 [Bacteroidota bacterium]|nr:hypothetical protein [Bacteroidota bacterium]
MNNQRKTFSIIVVSSLILVLVYWFLFSNKKDKFLWNKTYQETKKQPYDLGVFNELIKSKGNYKIIENKQSVSKFIETYETNATYLFVGEYCYLSKKEIDTLLSFASWGNQLVFISESIPDTLLKIMSVYQSNYKIKSTYESNVKIDLFYENSQLKDYAFNFRSSNKKYDKNIDWQYLERPVSLDYYYEYTDINIIPLGTMNSKTNFLKFNYGEGSIFIHTNPILFTNYALKESKGFLYMNECFNSINTQKIYYDIGAKYYKSDAEKMYQKSETPLSFILQKPALKWAWYLLCLGVVLFILFKIKRHQKIIPVIEQKRNTSIQFIQTLSGLFFARKQHYFMAEKKMQLFLYYLRSKFSIATNHLEPKAIKLLSAKSKVPEKEIIRIFDYYEQVIKERKHSVDETNLVELYARINNFYKIYKQNK